MTRVSLKHLSGSRRGRAEVFDLTPGRVLTLGRDPSCDLRYGEDDDIVSRRHVQIVLNEVAAPELLLIDLSSSNGTFVNNQRVFSPLKVRSGDVLRLGAGGPELKLELQAAAAKPERTAAPNPAATGPAATAAVSPPPPAMRRAGGRRRKHLHLLPVALIVVAAVGAAYYYAPRVKFRLPIGRAAAAHPRMPAAGSVVRVEWRWNLVDAASGRPLYLLFAPNSQASRDSELVAGAGPWLPVFVLSSGKLQPVLTASGGDGHSQPIAGAARRSGFFAAPLGAILTTQEDETQAGRNQSYGAAAGMLLVADSELQVSNRAALPAPLFPKWSPTNAGNAVEGELDSGAVRLKGWVRGRIGISSYVWLDGQFVPAKAAPIPGSSALVALAVATQRPAPSLEISADAGAVRSGEAVTVLGYAEGAGSEPPASAKPLSVPATITGQTADGGFEMAAAPTAVAAGAAVVGWSGRVIGVLQPQGNRWLAIPARSAQQVVQHAR